MNSSLPMKEYSIQIILRHKPRGCQGVWQIIKLKEGIRVCRKKGKNIQLVIKTNWFQLTYDKDIETKIFLFNFIPDKKKSNEIQYQIKPFKIEGPFIQDSISEEEKQLFGAKFGEFRYTFQISTVSKRQNFQVHFFKDNQMLFTANSIEFYSEDNGKVYIPKGRGKKNFQNL
jgi:hypothetical protein